MSQPGRGGGYIARNKRPPREGKESAFLTGKVSITCACGAHQDYFVDGFQRQKDGGTFYSLKLKAMRPKAQRATESRPGAGPARPGGAADDRPSATATRPGGTEGGRPGSGAPPRPGGAT